MLSDHLTPLKQRVQITGVDPSTRSIQGSLRDGATIAITVWEVPHSFVWPVVGENWSVRRESGMWLLGHRIETLNDGHSIQDLNPGQGKIHADVVVNRSGRTFVVAANPTGMAHGESLVWDSVVGAFVPSSRLSPPP